MRFRPVWERWQLHPTGVARDSRRLSISSGSHTLKFGAGAQRLAIWSDNRPSLGTWSFNVDQPFDPTKLATFVPVPGSVTQFATGNMVKLPTYSPNVLSSFYVEDEWKPAAGVTLNLGLRYDYQWSVQPGATLDSVIEPAPPDDGHPLTLGHSWAPP
jgi:outer membrane receptor protein involved in Fe transport